MENPELVVVVRESLAELSNWLRTHQLKLLSAAVLLALGWLLGLLMRVVVSRLFRALGRVLPGRLRHGLHRPDLESKVSGVIGLIVFWAVVLFFVAAAANVLGLPVLGASLTGIGLYVPRLIGAVLIVVAGLIVSNLARDAATAAAVATGTSFATASGRSSAPPFSWRPS